MMTYKYLLATIVTIISSVLIADADTSSEASETVRGPVFTLEPKNLLEFTNSSGVSTSCQADGYPVPTISWVTMDGKAAADIANIRTSYSNGTLHFLPFSKDTFRQSVHNIVYRCVATNPFGIIVSRDVHVHGVFLEHYEINVFDTHVVTGNTAVFKCQIPSHLSKYVKVTKWVRRDANLSVETEIPNDDDKYTILPNGNLHVHNVHRRKDDIRFACHTMHRLTKEKKISKTEGRIIISETRGSMPPRLEETPSSVLVKQGETIYLPCVFQGYPVPNAIWFAKLSKGQLLPIHIGERVRQTKSALIIEDTQPSDTATYVCTVSNGIGNERQETELTVAAPLAVQIEPKEFIGTVHKPATYRCSISGSPVTSVTWLKNGRPLVGSREQSTASEDILSLESLQMEDRGMYQCIVKNMLESVQASAELKLEDIAPKFQKTFEEITLKPGPPLSLFCSATGIPTPKIIWLLDDRPVEDSERVTVDETADINGKIESLLNVSDTHSKDGGIYKCVASNKMGDVEHAAKINIFGPPFIRSMPKISVIDGTSIRIVCPVSGHPITSITWDKGNRHLPINLRQLVFPNGTLIIEEVQREADSGTYTCHANNNQGEHAQQDVEVAVLVPPKITPFSFEDELLRGGTRARLHCVVSEGDLPITIRWTKDDVPIPPDLGVTLRDLDEFSSMLTIAVVTSRHNGNYTCIATNDAATVHHTAELSVNVPPKIVPFNFQDEHLFEGILVRVSCVVSRGDQPIVIRWEKDGKDIVPELGIVIRNFDEYSSVLSIDPLTTDHQGNYTCFASNSAATTSHSAQLIVKVPPKWLIEPENTAVLAGSNIMLHCLAEGFPEPSITWLKATDTTVGGQHEPIIDGEEFRLLHNRSLYIENATHRHRGHYVCQATNGIGRDLSTVVYLTVNFPPTVEASVKTITVRKGEKLHLTCYAFGDQPLNFTWFAGTHLVDPVLDGRYKTSMVTMPNSTTSELTVDSVDRRESTNFSCISQNPYGKVRKNISVTIEDAPDTVKGLSLEELGNRTVKLTWTHPFDGNSPTSQYVVEYKHSSDDWSGKIKRVYVENNETEVILRNLHPATSYHFRLLAENKIGISDPSEYVALTLPEEAPSRSPQDVEAEALDTQTIRVTWKPPPKEHWNGKLRGYYVGFKEVGESDPYTFKTIELMEDSSHNNSFRIGSLKNFTKYSIVIQAYNDKGRGPASREVLTMTSEDVPRKPPEDLQCSTLTSEAVLVSWQPPPPKAITGILRGYKVFYALLLRDYEEKTPPSVELTAHENVTLEKLHKYTNYSISVLAYTRAGEGPLSEPVYCLTLEDVPDPPAEIRALHASRSSVLVSWRPPIHKNGNITHYTAYAKKLDEKPEYIEIFPFEIPSNEFSYEFTELFWNWKYEFWVTASTSAGEGPPSAIATAVPDGPKIPARMSAFSESITTAWQKTIKLSCLCVGSPVPDKTWIKDFQALRETERIYTNPTQLLIENAQGNDTGNYTCVIKNRFGEDRIQHYLRVLVPPNSPVLKVGSVSYTSSVLEWSHEGDGGQPVLGFLLNYRPRDGSWKEITFPPNTNNYEFHDLKCGTTYTLKLDAFNKIGLSTQSAEITITTNGSVPEAPLQEEFVSVGINNVTLWLTSWLNEECPILKFAVAYKMKYNSEWIVIQENLVDHGDRFVIPGLLPSMPYTLEMTAENNAGPTTAHFEFTTLSRFGAPVLPEVVLASDDEKLDLYSYIDVGLVIPVTAAMGGLIIIITCMCICIIRTRSCNKTEDAMNKKKDLPKPVPRLRESKEQAKNVYVSPQQRPVPTPNVGIMNANPAANPQDELTPYATFQLVDQPHQQPGAFSAFPQMPPTTDQQPPAVPEFPNMQQFNRPEIPEKTDLPRFRSPAKDPEACNAHVVPSAPPLSEASSVTYDNQTSQTFQHSPALDRQFQVGQIKGNSVTLQPGYPHSAEGSTVSSMETTFIFPSAPEEGCIEPNTNEQSAKNVPECRVFSEQRKCFSWCKA